MYNMQLLKVIIVTLEQTPRELSVLKSMISPLGELPKMASRRPRPITGSPAGLSRGNGVRRSSAET